MNSPDTERLIGIDWLRLWAFLAITVFHGSWFFWPEVLGPPDPLPTALWRVLSAFAHYSSFSGFTVVLVTAFLLGRKRDVFDGKRWLPVFLLGGFVLFTLLLTWREGRFSFAWDVYPFLLLSFVSGDWILRKLPERYLLAFALTCVALVCVPFWGLRESIPGSPLLVSVLVGLCPEDYADWPLLPWVFLVWWGLAWGRIMRNRRAESDALLWPLVVVAASGLVSAAVYFGRTPLGDLWACYNFRPPFAIAIELFVGLAAALHLTTLRPVNAWLSRHSWTSWPSKLAINRHFFLAYVVHYVALFFVGELVQGDRLGLVGYDLGWVVAVGAAELVPRLVMRWRRG
jgi:hypothetical protein